MAIEIRKDSVWGMNVVPREAAGKSRFAEWQYCFCSAGCKEDFDRDPVKYLPKK